VAASRNASRRLGWRTDLQRDGRWSIAAADESNVPTTACCGSCGPAPEALARVITEFGISQRRSGWLVFARQWSPSPCLAVANMLGSRAILEVAEAELYMAMAVPHALNDTSLRCSPAAAPPIPKGMALRLVVLECPGLPASAAEPVRPTPSRFGVRAPARVEVGVDGVTAEGGSHGRARLAMQDLPAIVARDLLQAPLLPHNVPPLRRRCPLGRPPTGPSPGDGHA